MNTVRKVTQATLALSRKMIRGIRRHRHHPHKIIPLWKVPTLKRGDLGFYPGEKGWK